MPWNVSTQEWVPSAKLTSRWDLPSSRSIPGGSTARSSSPSSPERPDPHWAQDGMHIGWASLPGSSTCSVPTEPCRASHPLMEVAWPREPGARVAVPVTRTMQLTSDVVTTLHSGTTVKLRCTCVLHDGTRRACVLLDGVDGVWSGWLSVLSPEGAPVLHRFARPVYEVASASLKVRAGVHTESRFVRQLARGVRVHIVELKTSDGTTRARVAALGFPKALHEAPLGWITAQRAGDGPPKLVELQEDGARLARAPTALLTLCSPTYGFPWASRWRPPPSCDCMLIALGCT